MRRPRPQTTRTICFNLGILALIYFVLVPKLIGAEYRLDGVLTYNVFRESGSQISTVSTNLFTAWVKDDCWMCRTLDLEAFYRKDSNSFPEIITSFDGKYYYEVANNDPHHHSYADISASNKPSNTGNHFTWAAAASGPYLDSLKEGAEPTNFFPFIIWFPQVYHFRIERLSGPPGLPGAIHLAIAADKVSSFTNSMADDPPTVARYLELLGSNPPRGEVATFRITRTTNYLSLQLPLEFGFRRSHTGTEDGTIRSRTLWAGITTNVAPLDISSFVPPQVKSYTRFTDNRSSEFVWEYTGDNGYWLPLKEAEQIGTPRKRMEPRPKKKRLP